MSQPQRVLLTGGNGVVGSATLLALCEAGYNVHAVVRRQDAIDKTSSHPSIKKYSDQIQWSIVPDMTKPDAFLDAVRGCHYIIHVASPLAPMPPRPCDVRTPAVQGTQAIINAAESEPLVKRLVVTGSVASLSRPSETLPDHPQYQPGGTIPLMSGATYIPTPPERPRDDSSPFSRYADSKLASGNLVRDYAAAHPDSHFQVVLLCPSWVLGPGLPVRNKVEALYTANLTLAWMMLDSSPLLNPVWDLPPDVPTPLRSDSVWIDDVALAHVRGLSVPLPGGGNSQTWVLACGPPSGNSFAGAEEIVRRRLPEVAKHFSFAGKIHSLPVNVDGASAERELLGRPFVPFEEQVVRAVEWMVSLPDAEPASA
ncbi:hypothetical protein VMCG_07238 [Cytospora schulzeri]|uniref:NAD-dependent epimerase/dehydratase domain-containing protein n=1 Tax=Cytospora schulzeri TaxID=448051 RepID=A0A423WAH5_9PEZI|nr:hypothetical protein VMCG_07238 [Valsa malicola]